MPEKIKVMVVDSSAVARKMMRAIVMDAPLLELVEARASTLLALRAMIENWPSVIILDLELPEMDGIAFIQQVIVARPTPILIYTRHAEVGARLALEAITAGAVGVITKPNVYKKIAQDTSDEIVDAITEAASTNLCKIRQRKPEHQRRAWPRPPSKQPQAKPTNVNDYELIAIGTSMGGITAIETILTRLPKNCLSIVIVQHMPERYTKAFASRLNSLCTIDVKEAEDFDPVVPGRALIANGGKHLILQGTTGEYHVRLGDGPLVTRHKPSVDVLFKSVAASAASQALGIILTGMGRDGAEGMKRMFDAGCHTIAQDEESSAVYGMPKEAVNNGGVRQVLSLNDIACVIKESKNKGSTKGGCPL